ncbi:hypothetical protein ACIO93_09265 [Streptomyces sp. NPDC087903]
MSGTLLTRHGHVRVMTAANEPEPDEPHAVGPAVRGTGHAVKPPENER